MTIDELIQERPWFTRPVSLPHEPAGMLGKRESMLCYYLAKEAFTGRGTIVDAGSFLGRSAYHFAQGLRANPCYVGGRDRIHCFDNFLVNEIGTVQFIQNDLKQTASLGDSTREIFDAQVAPVRDMLEIHAGDFNTVEWQREPIEILMVDIAKSESLSKQVVKVFFPDLIPGESLVIQQDYHHPWLPHIHVVMEYLADYFELVVPRVDDSAVFRYRKAIPADILHHAATHDFTSEEQLELMDRAISRLPEEDRYYVQLAQIVLRSREVDGTVLHSELDELEQRFLRRARDYNVNTYFNDVRDHIDEWEGWRQIKASDFARALELADSVLLRRRNTHLLRLRGCALAGLGRHSEAEQEFRAALKMYDSSGVATIELARAIRHQDRLEEAEAEVLGGLGNRVATDTTSREYLNLLGEIWQLKNDPRHETVVLAELRREMPDDPEVEALATRMRQYRTAKVSAQTRPWQRLTLPAAVIEKRSMLCDEEKQYLTWLTTEKFEGWGAIVELGCWLGSSSIALAEGLRRRGSTAKIHSFDRFVWEAYMDTPTNANLKGGDDFLPLYLRELGEYAPWIQAHKVDLLNYSWDGGPIEILFVDSAKTWEVTNAILKGFGSSLVPGRSRIVLQDFGYPWAHCLPLIFDSRPDLWEEIESVDDGLTVTFMLLKRLDGPAGVQADYSEEAFPLQSAERLLRSRMARENISNPQMVERTLYRKYLIDGPLDEARKLREQIVAQGIEPGELATVEDVSGVLVPRGWKAYNEGNFEMSRASAERCLAVSGRSEYALTLLGFSLWRLGCLNQANDCIEEILSRLPNFSSALLFRAEVAVRDHRYGDVESDALRVLRDKPSDETTIAWALNVLSQAWNAQEAGERRLSLLHELEESFSQSPSFQAALTEAMLAQVVPPEAVLTGAVSHEAGSDDR